MVAQTYQSEYTGSQMDAKFTAVAELQSTITELQTAVAAKYSKPSGGIPSTDLDADVNAALAKANSAIQSLADYYTKAEVDALIAAINGQQYVDASSLPTASASTMGKIYLIGPDASGYYSYYYTSQSGNSYSWVGPLGTTEISLANYATKSELSQLDQEVTVSKMATPTVYVARDLRPAGSQNKVITGNADYDRIIPVTQGDYIQVTYAFPSNYVRYAFTATYPENNTAITGYADKNASSTSISIFAPITGYFLIAFGTEPTSFSALTDAAQNTVGNKVYYLDEDTKVRSVVPLDVTATRNLRPSSSTDKVVTGNNGYSYIAMVKQGQKLTIKFAIASSYIYYGFTQVYPANNVAVTGAGNKNSSFTQLAFTAPFDGFFLADFGVEPSSVSIESPNDADAIGNHVAALEAEAARKIDAGDFLGVPAPVNIFYPAVCENGYLDAGGAIVASDTSITTPRINVAYGETYVVAYGLRAAQYDVAGNFISGTFVSMEQAASTTITIAETAAYLRVTIYGNDTFRAMICKDSLPASYVPYRINVPFLSPLSKYEGKKVVLFGDSTTACIPERSRDNWGAYLTNATGMVVENVGIWSSRAALSNSVGEVANAFSLASLVDGIVTGDWDAQDVVYETSGYEQHAAQITKLKAIDFTKVDFVVIMIGTNDFSTGTPFETADEPLDKYSINGALRYFVSEILGEYPQLKVLLCSPIFRFNPSTGADAEYNNRTLQDFVDDYKELGEELHIPTADMLSIGVNKYNCDLYYGENGGDGVHETNAMREVIGNRVAGLLTSLY